ncbi:autotransporter outer membrane beta-barrel domain-containing protein [Aquabacter spiritensis]|uniref:Outer membrane autotransporter protein n=1 Tax=Aquabacter spiritensis TaxID=933073 RepID=A0A4R3LTQ1_9HYPH|nr:autotransporter domain-containing protein [Aquabacter spiritensis]TCT03884.1 outer membrane autotransporter protein [Aquabacter spiritensis]
MSAACGLASAGVASATDIPLTYGAAPTNSSYRLTINVGVNDGVPQTYLFDTGSSGFNADFHFTSGSAPTSYTTVVGTPFYFTYGDSGPSHGFYETAIAVPEISFYKTLTGPAVATVTAASPGFLMGDVIYPVTYNGSTYTPQAEVQGDAAGTSGTFGAANATTSNYGGIVFGGILGQATTSGYVIAANCLSEGSGCNPHVILNLTPSIRAQFDQVFGWSANGTPFPTSGANSAELYAITFNYNVVGSNNSGSYQYPANTLLDTGTNTYNLYVNASVAASALSAVSSMVVSNPQSGAVLQTVNGASSGPNIINFTTGSPSVRTILGIGFFMGNSVMYDLANNQTGITSFFVTDQDAEATGAAPFTVGASTGNAGQFGMAGVISGAGGVVVTQGGQAKLSAANTFAGTTTINQGGWLGLVGPGSIAQSAGVVNNGVFDISGTGIVPGTAGLTTNGASITTLSGSGLVSLGGQTLTLTAASGTYSGVLADGGYAGGAGGGLIISGGTETLSGANTYTGGTAVQSGATLILTGSLAGSVINGGTIQNSGSIGGPVVNQGWLADNGTVGGSVLNSGLVTGNGTIGGDLVMLNGSVVAPGNSIGTLHVGGNVVFQPGSSYAVQINAGGASDLIQAGGAAAINGGAVQVSVGSGFVVGLNTFSILTANGGVGGQFTSINDPFGTNYPFLDAALIYGPNGISLISTRSSVPLASVARNANQAAVAAALDTIPATGPLVNAVVSLNASTAPAAFSALSGGIYPSIDTVLQAQSVYFRDAVTDRLRQAFATAAAPAVGPKTAALMPGLLPTVWTQAYGSWGDGEGGAGVADVSRSIGGFVTGLDNPIGDNARIGLAAGYSQSRFKAGALSSSGESDNYDVALYGGAEFGALGLRLGASYTWHDVSVSRSVAFQGFSQALSSSYDAGSTQVFAEAGYGIATPYADFELFAGVAHVSLQTDAMSETGGAAALQSGSSTQDNTFTALGLRAAKGFAVNGGTVTASASLGWQYAFGDTTPISTLSFKAGGSAFQETGTPIARNAALVGVGFDFTATPNITVGFHYAGQLAGSSQDNAIDGRISIKF